MIRNRKKKRNRFESILIPALCCLLLFFAAALFYVLDLSLSQEHIPGIYLKAVVALAALFFVLFSIYKMQEKLAYFVVALGCIGLVWFLT